MYKKNLIMDLSFDFAGDVVHYCQELQKERSFTIANQLIKAGTSIGANVREAQNGESVADFIHKIKIAAKEAEEAEYWLLLSMAATGGPANSEMIDKLTVIKKILNKIITTSKHRINNPR